MQTKPLRGVHVFWMVFVFFALVIGADTLFIVRAVGTFPGEKVKNSYVLGLDYNREVESRARQEELGWSAEAGIEQGEKPTLVVRMANRSQEPVTGLDVFASYFIVGGGREERQVVLIEIRPGEYRGQIDAAASSRIEFNIGARRRGSDSTIFQAGKTAVVS
jgi:nitrogen fixation protein FixH